MYVLVGIIIISAAVVVGCTIFGISYTAKCIENEYREYLREKKGRR